MKQAHLQSEAPGFHVKHSRQCKLTEVNVRRTFCSMQNYDVIVIGGGHAGCEAAAATARVGAIDLRARQYMGHGLRRTAACTAKL